MTDYQKAQLKWMIDHDCSLEKLIDELDLCRMDWAEDNETIHDIYTVWEHNIGFDGKIWPSMAEWKDREAANNADAGAAQSKEKQEPLPVRVFLWNGLSHSVQVPAGREGDVNVTIYNCDEEYSDSKRFDFLVDDDEYQEANWKSDDLSEESEEE